MVITMKHSTTFQKQILAALSLIAMLVGGCVSVGASVPEIQLVQSGMEFPAMADEMRQQVGEVSISRNFSYSLDAMELPEGLHSNVRIVGVSLLANYGIEDFAFLRSLKITINDEVNPAFELASFERHAHTPNDDGVLVMKFNPQIDTLALLKSESMEFVVDLTGSPPAVDWSVDLQIDMSGDLQFRL
jgi:hypothetical protein